MVPSLLPLRLRISRAAISFRWHSAPAAPFTPTGTYVAVQPDLKATTVYSWNLALQRQLAKDWVVSATYVGTETAHLWVSYQLNPAVFTPGATSTATNQARRVITLLNPAHREILYGPVDQFDSGGTVNYNGLLLSTKTRLGEQRQHRCELHLVALHRRCNAGVHGRRRAGRPARSQQPALRSRQLPDADARRNTGSRPAANLQLHHGGAGAEVHQ